MFSAVSQNEDLHTQEGNSRLSTQMMKQFTLITNTAIGSGTNAEH